MSTNTDTRKPVNVPAPPRPVMANGVPKVGDTPKVSNVPSVSDLRDALAVVNAGDARGTAGTTLKAIVLARYAYHATGAARATSDEGSRFIDADTRKEIALAMWHEAGHGTAPAADSRTPGDKSLAQYVAKFGTVASNMGKGYGVAALESVKSADSAYNRIREASNKSKGDTAARALLAWESSLNGNDSAAVRKVRSLLTTHGKHVAAEFARQIAAANKESK